MHRLWKSSAPETSKFACSTSRRELVACKCLLRCEDIQLMRSNLVMANRAILLVPLFNLDTQAQAIKVGLNSMSELKI